jgi:hypothetical protein
MPLPEPPTRRAELMDKLLRWQIAANLALATGSLTAAILNMAALVAASIAQSTIIKLKKKVSIGVNHG